MKNIIIVIFVLFSLCGGCLGRFIAVLSKVQEPINNVKTQTDGEQQLVRAKRQWGFGPYGQSSSLANANAFNNYYGPQGFGSSSALAGAQGFNSQSPFGGFGANSANAASQGFHVGPGGFGANAAFSGSQNYRLPGNRNVGISYGNTYSNANGVPSIAQSGGITYT